MTMEDSQGGDDGILVAIGGSTALVSVQGRGSYKAGPALKRFGALAMEQGANRFVLDMRNCVGMDSTFMGVLAGLAQRLTACRKGGMLMVNLNAKTLNQLTTLGVDCLIETHLAGPETRNADSESPDAGKLEGLNTTKTDRHISIETMLEAHKDLVRLAPGNLPKFKDVIEFLDQDLKQLKEE